MIAARFLEQPDPQVQRRQLFAELIVHLARDAPPLVFLRKDEPRQQLGAGSFGVGELALGEVEMRAHDAHDGSARFVANRKSTREHMNVAAVLVPQAEFSFVGRRAAHDALVDFLRAGLVVRVQQVLPGDDRGFDLVVGVAQHLFPAGRIHDAPGFEIPVPYAFLGAREGEREALLALPESRFRPLALGDIEMGAHDAHDRSPLPADRKPSREHVDVVAILVAQTEFAHVRPFAAPRALGQFRRQGLVVRMEHALPSADMRLDLVVGVAEHLLPPR